MSNKKNRKLFKYFKRFFDILCALLGVIVLIFISIIIKLSMLLIGDKDTIFFKQERTGLNGKKFELIKFRSMKITNDVRDTSKEDEFTKIGLFIRKTSLDELPQVINILRGEMSFIGPRPWIPEYYENMTKKQRKRVSVLPGITGLAQVNGRNGLSVIDKINYDLEYVNNYSFLQDLKIIIKTIKTIFSKEDAYTDKIGIQNEIEVLKNQ
ncbi:MAG: sugar transferase [bacterium]|nr:sugar transferase [bacterium]